MSGLLALAFGAGLLAPVNPCGFALLPAYLTTFMQPRTGDPPPSVGRRLRRALSTGLAVTLGFSATLTAVGVALAAGLRALTEVIPWLAVAVGVILTVAGVVMLFGRTISARLPGAASGASRLAHGHRLRLLGFGAGYAIASASCTLGILLAVVAAALAAGTMAAAAAVFAAYAAGSAVLLLALAVAAALAGTALARALGRVARHASRIAGLLLAGSGLYLVAYWMPSLLGGTSAAPADNPLTRAAAGVTSWITAHQAPVVLVAGGVIAAGAGAAILATRSRRDDPPSDCCPPERAPVRRLGHDAGHPD